MNLYNLKYQINNNNSFIDKNVIINLDFILSIDYIKGDKGYLIKDYGIITMTNNTIMCISKESYENLLNTIHKLNIVINI